MSIELRNVVVPSREFAASVTFYRDGLGLDVLHDGPGFCFLSAGPVNIAIQPAAPDTPFVPTGHGSYLDFFVTDLAALKEGLSRAGYEASLRKEWEDEGLRYLLVADPDGNLLEICEPKDHEP